MRSASEGLIALQTAIRLQCAMNRGLSGAAISEPQDERCDYEERRLFLHEWRATTRTVLAVEPIEGNKSETPDAYTRSPDSC
jgi:hypothetical protein